MPSDVAGPRRLRAGTPGFDAALTALLDGRSGGGSDVAGVVSDIIADVRARGDAALIDHTRRLDGVDLAEGGIALPPEALDAATARCPPEQIAALDLAAGRIRAFHERQRPVDLAYEDALGVRLGLRWRPVDAVGLYVPGGTASYPSSVLMNAIPARVAGVERVVMAVPTPQGAVSDLVLAAARRAGVDVVYRIGGAQAIAALAYGTASVAPVDVIVGPGNAYVAEAKRQVYGRVGIDSVAGPSEVLVIADDTAPAAWIAADLLAQAEHDVDAQSILITDSAALADAVADAIEHLLPRLDRAAIAAASWNAHGAIIVVARLDDAVILADRIAPEHLELAVADPEALAAQVRHAGAIFLGRHTPEAIGDYVGGPNHVLPTSGAARFASGLGVLDFMKRTTLLGCDAAQLGRLGPAAIALAEAEGLGAHALSIELRDRPGGP